MGGKVLHEEWHVPRNTRWIHRNRPASPTSLTSLPSDIPVPFALWVSSVPGTAPPSTPLGYDNILGGGLDQHPRGHRDLHSRCISLIRRTSSIPSSFTSMLNESMWHFFNKGTIVPLNDILVAEPDSFILTQFSLHLK